jgi:formate--tetrahydrofolate ligase
LLWVATVVVMRTDLEIARATTLRPITEVAEGMGVPASYIEPRGEGIAKIKLEAINEMGPPRAKYILVTAVNPTPFGEGKTTVSVGLAQGFKLLDEQAVLTLRQPSLGPTFGIKGGAAGGGYSQVVPMEEMNLHLTGDFHAITVANNLLAALIDNHIYQGNQLSINVKRVTWRRVMDVNDRALRHIVVGLGSTLDGIPREDGFDITAASELMAILGLATDLKDLRERLGRIVIGYDRHKNPVTAEDIKGAGPMAVLLKDALNPNLLQTLEGTPAIIHTGPFANIAHGNSSIVADEIGIRSGDYLITEAGFGSDVGAEKFFNLKCRASGLAPDVAVIVATVRALKLNSGKFQVRAGKPLPEDMVAESPDDVIAGAANLRRHIANIRQHGVVPVVAVNRFPTDHESELEAIGAIAKGEGAAWAIADPFSGGSEAMVDLAEVVRDAAKEGSDYKPLYPSDASLRDKIETIATQVYGADGVKYDMKAVRQLADYEAHGYGGLPICMAKTQYSFSHDPKLLGAPEGWILPIREVQLVAGAGFVLPLTGSINRMPGLGLHPAAHSIDIDENGEVVGLS